MDGYSAFERPLLTHPAAVTADEVRKEPAGFLVNVDLFNMTELVDLDPASGTYIHSKTEPFNDEMEIDDKRMHAWLKAFNLTAVKAHASGHASREELEHMIDSVKPRMIVPVHTLNVKAFEQRFGDRVTRPVVGTEVPL
jgi:ribonuclease J